MVGDVSPPPVSDEQRRDPLLRLFALSDLRQIKGHRKQEVDARIELLASVYNGLLVRAVLHPQLDRQQLLQALRPWLRQLLAA